MSELPVAYLSELFCSTQGEGPWVGERQIFVRFYGCHLNCRFCDTPETVTARQPKGWRPESFEVEHTPGARDMEARANPVGVEDLLNIVRRLVDGDEVVSGDANEAGAAEGLNAPTLALTGGEPLLHVDFLEAFLPAAKSEGFRIYLETAGDLATPLRRVARWVDVVAMDIKAPSVTGDRDRFDAHREFLRVCVGEGLNVFCKLIAGASLTDADFDRAVELVRVQRPETPFVIQPMTPHGPELRAEDGPTSRQLLDWQARASRRLRDVRVIPQCHKMMGAL